MFGYVAFAQSPFASLGSNLYAVSIAEALTLADNNAATVSFLSSITENLNTADAQTVVAAFAWCYFRKYWIMLIRQALLRVLFLLLRRNDY